MVLVADQGHFAAIDHLSITVTEAILARGDLAAAAGADPLGVGDHRAHVAAGAAMGRIVAALGLAAVLPRGFAVVVPPPAGADVAPADVAAAHAVHGRAAGAAGAAMFRVAAEVGLAP